MKIGRIVRPCILNLKTYKPGKPIEELKRELKIKHVVKMASNENSLGPSPKAMKAIKKALPEINRYPDGECFYLKKAIAKKYGLKSENIIIGNGSDEIIVLTLKTFINRGDEVIVAEPTFLIYRLAAMLAEAKVISVPLKAYRYDLQAIKAKISKRTKLIFIANPDNPTGSYVHRSEVENFLKFVPNDVLVYFDEAYFEYVRKKDYPDALQYIRKGNVIVSRSFSKAFGLSGLRIGWAAATRDIIYYLNQVREPFNVNRLAQAAAVAALSDERHIQRSVNMIRQGMNYLCGQFKKLNLFYVPSVTNFILVNIGNDCEKIYHQLLQSGIIVREMSDWGLRNFIRVTIGKKTDNRMFINILKTALAHKKGAQK